MATTTLEKWVDDRQSVGRYTFLRREAIEESGLSAEAVKKALQRLTLRGRIAKAKSYFYVIVPLEYATAGAPPVTWVVKDLMTAMALPYYVGLLRGAARRIAPRVSGISGGDGSLCPPDCRRAVTGSILRQQIRHCRSRSEYKDAHRIDARVDRRDNRRRFGEVRQIGRPT
jgi:hypothetical protein